MSDLLKNISRTGGKPVQLDSMMSYVRENATFDPTSALRTPEYAYHPKDLNVDRYKGATGFDHYGFSVFRDNETLYDATQTTGEWWANTLNRFGTRTGKVFIDGFRYLDGFRDIRSNLAAVEEGDRENFTSMEEQLQARFPTFSSPYEGTGLGAYFSQGAHGKWSQLIDQFGFTTGTIANFIVTEAALAIATEGLGLLSLPVQFAKTGERILAFNKAARLAQKSKAYRSLREYSNVFGKQAFSFWDKTKKGLIAYGKGKPTSGFAPLTTKGFGQLSKGLQSGNYLQVAGGVGKIGLGAWNQFNIASNEAIIESAENAAMYRDHLLEEFLQQNLREPNANELEEIEDKVANAAGYTYWGNVAVLMASNAITGSNILSNFRSASKIKNLGLYANSMKNMAKTGKLVSTFKDLPTGRKILIGLGNTLKSTAVAPITEGMEESLQRTVATAARDYVSKKYNKEAYTLVDSLAEGLRDGFGHEGMEEFWAGFMTGALTGAAGSVYKGATSLRKNKNQENIDKNAEIINGQSSTLFKILNTSVSEQVSIAKMLEDTSELEDYVLREDGKKMAITGAVLTLLDSGAFDLWIEQLSGAKNLSKEEIIGIIPEASSMSKEDIEKGINEIISIANNVKEKYNNFSMTNPYEDWHLEQDVKLKEEKRQKNMAWIFARNFVISNQANVENTIKSIENLKFNFGEHEQTLIDLFNADGRQSKILNLKERKSSLEESLKNPVNKSSEVESKKELDKVQKELEFLESYEKEVNTLLKNKIRTRRTDFGDFRRGEADFKEAYEFENQSQVKDKRDKDGDSELSLEDLYRSVDVMIQMHKLRTGETMSRSQAQDLLLNYIEMNQLESDVRFSHQMLNYMDENFDDLISFTNDSITDFRQILLDAAFSGVKKPDALFSKEKDIIYQINLIKKKLEFYQFKLDHPPMIKKDDEEVKDPDFNPDEIQNNIDLLTAELADLERQLDIITRKRRVDELIKKRSEFKQEQQQRIADLEKEIEEIEKSEPVTIEKIRDARNKSIVKKAVQNRVAKINKEISELNTSIDNSLIEIEKLQEELEQLSWISEYSDKRIKKRSRFLESDITTSLSRDVLEVDSISGKDLIDKANSILETIKKLEQSILDNQEKIVDLNREVEILDKEITLNERINTVEDIKNKIEISKQVLNILQDLIVGLKKLFKSVLKTIYKVSTSVYKASTIATEVLNVNNLDKEDYKAWQDQLDKVFAIAQRSDKELADSFNSLNEKDRDEIVDELEKDMKYVAEVASILDELLREASLVDTSSYEKAIEDLMKSNYNKIVDVKNKIKTIENEKLVIAQAQLDVLNDEKKQLEKKLEQISNFFKIWRDNEHTVDNLKIGLSYLERIKDIELSLDQKDNALLDIIQKEIDRVNSLLRNEKAKEISKGETSYNTMLKLQRRLMNRLTTVNAMLNSSVLEEVKKEEIKPDSKKEVKDKSIVYRNLNAFFTNKEKYPQGSTLVIEVNGEKIELTVLKDENDENAFYTEKLDKVEWIEPSSTLMIGEKNVPIENIDRVGNVLYPSGVTAPIQKTIKGDKVTPSASTKVSVSTQPPAEEDSKDDDKETKKDTKKKSKSSKPETVSSGPSDPVSLNEKVRINRRNAARYNRTMSYTVKGRVAMSMIWDEIDELNISDKEKADLKAEVVSTRKRYENVMNKVSSDGVYTNKGEVEDIYIVFVKDNTKLFPQEDAKSTSVNNNKQNGPNGVPIIGLLTDSKGMVLIFDEQGNLEERVDPLEVNEETYGKIKKGAVRTEIITDEKVKQLEGELLVPAEDKKIIQEQGGTIEDRNRVTQKVYDNTNPDELTYSDPVRVTFASPGWIEELDKKVTQKERADEYEKRTDSEIVDVEFNDTKGKDETRFVVDSGRSLKLFKEQLKNLEDILPNLPRTLAFILSNLDSSDIIDNRSRIYDFVRAVLYTYSEQKYKLRYDFTNKTINGLFEGDKQIVDPHVIEKIISDMIKSGHYVNPNADIKKNERLHDSFVIYTVEDGKLKETSFNGSYLDFLKITSRVSDVESFEKDNRYMMFDTGKTKPATVEESDSVQEETVLTADDLDHRERDEEPIMSQEERDKKDAALREKESRKSANSFFGVDDAVAQEQPASKQPVSETVDKSSNEDISPEMENLLSGVNEADFDDGLERSKNTPGVTDDERNQKLEERFAAELEQLEKSFKNVPKLKDRYKLLNDLVNSTAWGTWSVNTVNIFKNAPEGTILHEMWHDFSQFFLTVQEKKDLYNELLDLHLEIKNDDRLSTKEKYKKIEELIAEDWVSYMKSNGEKVLGQRVYRNKIFRQILNWFKSLVGKIFPSLKGKELFTPDGATAIHYKLQELYNTLKNGDLDEKAYSTDNAMFGKLYSAKTVREFLEGNKLTKNNVERSYQMIVGEVSSLVLEFIRKYSAEKPEITIDSFLNNPSIRKQAYTYIRNEYARRYNEVTELYDKETNPKTQEILYSFRELYSGLTDDHIMTVYTSDVEMLSKRRSDTTLVTNEEGEVSEVSLTGEELDENSRNKDVAYTKNADETRSFDIANEISRFLTKGIVQFTLKKGKFLPATENGITKTIPSETIWNIIQEEVADILDYDEFLHKLIDITHKAPEIIQFITALPVYNQEIVDRINTRVEELLHPSYSGKFVKKISPLNSQNELIRKSIYGDFKRANVTQRIAITRLEADGNLAFSLARAENTKAIILQQELSALLNEKISARDEKISEYYFYYEKTGNSKLNNEKINQYIKEHSSKLGMLYTSTAINNPNSLDPFFDFFDIIGLEMDRNAIKGDRQKRIEFANSQPYKIVEFFKDLPSSLVIMEPLYFTEVNYKRGKELVQNQATRLKMLLNLELKNRPNFASNTILDATGKQRYEKTEHTFLTQMVSELNNVSKYETYEDAIKSEFLKHLDYRLNPDVRNSILLNSVFDLETGKRRRIGNNGEYVTLSMSNMNGIVVLINGRADNDGTKTTPDLSEIEKLLLQEIPSLLIAGMQSNIRASDKSMEYSFRINQTTAIDSKGRSVTNTDGLLNVIDVEAFVKSGKGYIADILLGYLKDEIALINDFKKNGSSVKERQKRRGDFVLFDDILSSDLKKILLSEEAVDSNRDQIIKEVMAYFDKYTDKIYNHIENAGASFILDTMNVRRLKDQSAKNKVAVYFVLSTIHNIEQLKFFYGDPSLFKDPIKRFPMFNSNGRTPIIDAYSKEYMKNDPYHRYGERKYTGKDPEIRDHVNVAVVQDLLAIVDEKTVENILTLIKDKKKEFSDAYLENPGDKTDAQCLCTLDFYKNIVDSMGEWSSEQEALYKAIINNEKVPTSAGIFFPPLKLGYSGNAELIKENGTELTKVYHKYSIVPIIPHAYDDYAIQDIERAMYEQGLDYITFESASKVGTYVGEDGKTQPIYTNGKVTPNLRKTKLYMSGFKNQLKVAPEQKKQVVFGTQFRKLLFSDLFEHGVPIDFKPKTEYEKRKKEWEKLVQSGKVKSSDSFIYQQLIAFNNAIDDIIKEGFDRLAKDYGIEIINGQFVIEDATKLAAEIKKQAQDQAIYVDGKDLSISSEGKIKNILESTRDSLSTQILIFSLLNKTIVKQKLNGEALVQVSSVGFELKQSLSSEDKKYQEDLKVYDVVEGKIRKMEVMVSFNKNAYGALLNLPDNEGKKIGTVDKLNEMMKDESFRKLHEEALTMVGYRIPTQGHNSMEILTVKRFLPEASTNLIVVPGMIVTKTGSDFDIDKMQFFRKKIKRNFKNKEIVNKTVEELLKQPVVLTHLQTMKEVVNYPITNTIRRRYSKESHSSMKLFEKEFNKSYLQELLNSYFNMKYEDVEFHPNDLKIIKKMIDYINKTDGISIYEIDKQDPTTRIIEVTENILTHPSVTENLLTPNSTNKIKKMPGDPGYENYYEEGYEDPKFVNTTTNMINPLYIMMKRIANFDGKRALGIGAIANTLNALYQLGDFSLSSVFEKDDYNFNTNFYLKHNSRDGKVSMSDIRNQNGDRISEIINQLINAYVDVGTDDFAYYINAGYNNTPVLVHAVIAGTPIDDILALLKIDSVKRFVRLNDNKIVRTLYSKLNNTNQVSNLKLMTKEFLKVLDNKDVQKFLENNSEFADVIESNFVITNLNPNLNTVANKELGFGNDSNKNTFYKKINNITSHPVFAKLAKEVLSSRESMTKSPLSEFVGLLQFIELQNQSETLREEYHLRNNYDTTLIKSFGEAILKNRDDIKIKEKESSIVSQKDRESLEAYSPIKNIKIHDKIEGLFKSLYPIFSKPEVMNLFFEIVDRDDFFTSNLDSFSKTFFNDVSQFYLHNSSIWKLRADQMNVTNEDNIHKSLLDVKNIIRENNYDNDNFDVLKQIISYIEGSLTEDEEVKHPELVRFRKFKNNRLSEEDVQIYRNAWTNLVKGKFVLKNKDGKRTDVEKEHEEKIIKLANELGYIALLYFGWNYYPGSFQHLVPNEIYATVELEFNRLKDNSDHADKFEKFFVQLFAGNNRSKFFRYSREVTDEKVGPFKNYNVKDQNAMEPGDQRQATDSEVQSKQNRVSKSTTAERIVNSGGAYGADSLWDEYGKPYNVKAVHFYSGDRSEYNAPKGNQEITSEDYNEGRYEAANAARRNWGYEYRTMKDDRLIRNWAQVKYSDSVFAIGKIVKIGERVFPDQKNDTRKAISPSVTGGTGYAVGMAINHNKPVYVFNQEKNSYEQGWYKWDNSKQDFVRVETPILTSSFAGIGTRNINEAGKQAIKDIYAKSFGLKTSAVSQQVSESQSITTDDEIIKDQEKMPWTENPFEQIVMDNENGIITMDDSVQGGVRRHDYYIRGQRVSGQKGDPYMSVSDFLGNNARDESPLLKIASSVGSVIDNMAKDFIDGKLTKESVVKYQSSFVNPNDAIKILTRFKQLKKTLSDLGYSQLYGGAKLEGIVKDENGKDRKVIGEIDILAFNPFENKYVIVDIKTHRGGPNKKGISSLGEQSQLDPKLTKYVRQQSTYKQLLSQKGIPIENIDIYLFNLEIGYPDGSNNVNPLNTDGIIEMVYDNNVIKNRSKQLEVKDGMFVSIPTEENVWNKHITLEIINNKRHFTGSPEYNIYLFRQLKGIPLSEVENFSIEEC